jgi:hypothetical protein
MREKRKFERVSIRVAAVIEVDGKEAMEVGEAVDLSLGGMFVAGVGASFGALVRIRVCLPGSEAAVVLPGVVRWVREDGAGVQFGLLGARETYSIMNATSTQRASLASGTFQTDTHTGILDLDLADLETESTRKRA